MGALGHGDEGARDVPSRVVSLSRIECIAAGRNRTSAAVDEDGGLFTWGRASVVEEKLDGDGQPQDFDGPSGLGYELEPSENQPTPKRVDSLSPDHVLSVALGSGFTLAVTDAGAVFSFGSGTRGLLGHGSLEHEVLPRRIKALAKMELFVAVAAGRYHALALTEGGELYGWGVGRVNGHGRAARTPHRVAALMGKRVKLLGAGSLSACAVTEEGELFTWGVPWHGRGYFLGHGINTIQTTPKRVEALVGTKIAAVAMGVWDTLAADEDGAVWAFGERRATGLGGPDPRIPVRMPTLIPTLRVRALKSP